MSRSLRPRTSRPSYAVLADIQDDAGRQFLDELDSGSDFAPEPDPVNPPQHSVAETNDDASDDEHTVHQNPILPASKTQKKKPPTRAAPSLPAPSAGGLIGAVRRHMYTLPAPSLHHRHRAPPLYYHQIPTMRLTKPPELFKPAVVTVTNNFLHSHAIAHKLSKTWGHSVGPGPVWDLLEDRGWFKEAALPTSREWEGYRRPRVYHRLRVKSDWEVLNEEQANAYLPSDTSTTENGTLMPPPPVVCNLGKYGSQTRVEMPMFQALPISDFIPGSKSHVFNAGAPVWAIDWCPIHPEDREARSFKQYLAVAPLPSQSYSPEIGVRVSRPMQSCVQIWSFGPDAASDIGKVYCEMVLCLESGPAHELKWCPLPSHDAISDSTFTHRPRKLGLLAGTFEDGSLSVHAVPDPLDVRPLGSDLSRPAYVKLPEPILRVEIHDSCCWSFDWANSEVIAIGTTNGSIAVYNIAKYLYNDERASPTLVTDILPTHFIPIHQSAIRSLVWVRMPPCSASGELRNDLNPTIIASGGYDGSQCLTDIREGTGFTINRTRDVINTIAYSPYCPGPVSTDHENIVKAFSISPGMLGRGHTLMDPEGPPWSIHASDYHPIIALGSADGACSTTNSLRPPRRGTVPYFIHKLYQLDYSRKTGEYRVLECLLPKEMHILPMNDAKNKKSKQADEKPVGTDAWPKEVGVHRVVWNVGNGFEAANMLASATASGLCRIDVPTGRWYKDKVPYRSVAVVRGEITTDEQDMEVDEDDLSD